MYDDATDPTILFASDEARINRGNITLPAGRTETIARNSVGVYRGKLSDIDDLSLFEVILERYGVTYFFKEKLGATIWISQQNELSISFDKGSNWSHEMLGYTISSVCERFRGIDQSKKIVIDRIIIAIK
jgi:hypothetical protein